MRSIVAYALEFSFGALENILPWPPSSWLGIAVCVEYALIFAFVWLNRARRSFWAIAAGSILNFVVIAANGFRMPISPVVYDYPQFANIIERVGGGEMVEYVLVGWDGPLWWLGDTIPVLFITPGLASIGDIALAVGVFILIQEKMCIRDSCRGWATRFSPCFRGWQNWRCAWARRCFCPL